MLWDYTRTYQADCRKDFESEKVNTPVTFKYNFSELNIGTTQIEKLIGYDPGTAPEPIPDLIKTVLNAAEEYTDIKGKYLITDGYSDDNSRESIRINGQDFNTGKIVITYIRKSEQFVFFIVTAGKEVELQSHKYLHGNDPLLGYIFDVFGSLTVESAVGKFQLDLEEHFRKVGLKTTNPYSPGYCGWPVSDQQKLFTLFGNDTCGIRLSETCLMDPIKSISGIIGVGKNVKKQPYSCTICDIKNCLYQDKK
jgi:hypothetical protein